MQETNSWIGKSQIDSLSFEVKSQKYIICNNTPLFGTQQEEGR